MNRLRQLILTFILLWIAVKMAFFFTGNAQEGMVISVFLNLLFILLVEFFALRFKYETTNLHQSNFLIDMKDCVKAGATYVVFVVLFLVCYYYLIHPELFQGQIEDRVALAIEQSSDPEYFEELKRQNVNQIPPNATPEDYVDGTRADAEQFLGWAFVGGMSLMVLTVLSIFNAVFITLLYRKVLLK